MKFRKFVYVVRQLPDRESILGPLQQVMETRLDVMKKVSQLQGRLNLIFAQVTTAGHSLNADDNVIIIISVACLYGYHK